jgi:hypothetical protein
MASWCQMYSVNSILVDMKYNGLWFVKVFHYILVARTSCILVRLWLSLQTQLRYGTELWFIFQVCCTSTCHQWSLITSCHLVFLASSWLYFNLSLTITSNKLLLSIRVAKKQTSWSKKYWVASGQKWSVVTSWSATILKLEKRRNWWLVVIVDDKLKSNRFETRNTQ